MTYFYSDQDDNYYLSNFYPYPFKSGGRWQPLNIEYDGQLWPTSEHLYQALKFKNETVEEKEWREIIRTANTPTISKYLGHQYTYIRYKWHVALRALVQQYQDRVRFAGNVEDDEFRKHLMMITVQAKFTSCPLLMEKLKATSGMIGEKSNDVWGLEGQNYLGQILMAIRDA